ncbi:NnrS family protein [Diaphorobacter sp. HDW4A]|uniref:NnrS family protein n=1 Tax=Diaphorobacter sp. HDW4A TaxID=2714924 RepID=UPI001F0F231B|nr:NnrS family protein [Diaphorobacter sp. HDW4A]
MNTPQPPKRPGIGVQKIQPSGTPHSALPAPDMSWRVGTLAHAPHRLSFFLAMVVLIASGIWWALVQIDRSLLNAGTLPYAIPAMLTHAMVMCFGFLPLFFAGFLFTAGPKWLNVEPPTMRAIMPPLLMQAAGWLLWLAGSMGSVTLAFVGIAAAWLGFVWMCSIYWRLVLRSRLDDRIHATAIAIACMVGCVGLGGAALALALGRADLARALVHTGIWGFVGVVYVVVAHRMIPFFTSSALPFIDAWRPFWVLWLLLGCMALRVADVWLALLPLPASVQLAWAVVSGVIELCAGLALLWLAYRWGLVQSLKNRLLAMLHIGFSWIGIAFVLAGAVRLVSLFIPIGGGDLAALHAFTMGALGSLLLAMVTRVSCGHSGRMLHADRLVWGLFCLLQVTVVLRVVAAFGGGLASYVLTVAALLWAAVVTVWGARLCTWYGKPRADGRAG